MVHIKPDLEAGTAEERAEVPPPPAQYDHYNEDTDEEPDVEDIEVNCQVRSGDFLGVLAGKYFDKN